MTVERAQAGFAGGAFTSETLTKAFLDRIAVYNPPYNAIVFMNPIALDDARSSDSRRASPSLGSLRLGVTVQGKRRQSRRACACARTLEPKAASSMSAASI
jgi:Asp-tRNA(Asn)/Glu-tRNA(Gln) amidotransferase A subunit family amidase